jgi:hypothetical protein
MRTLITLQGCPIYHFQPQIDGGDERVVFTADADIDCDGSGGNPDHDPYFQPDTTLHYEGRALNAYKERFIVVPPAVCRGTKGRVLGSRVRVHYLRTGRICDAVVGDIGPTKKVGELSPACALALGMNPNPNTGGEDHYGMVVYEIWPEQPAILDGVQYQLMKYGG